MESNTLRKLFSERINKKELKALMQERWMDNTLKAQWQQDASPINPLIGQSIWRQIEQRRMKKMFMRRAIYTAVAASIAILLMIGSSQLLYHNEQQEVEEYVELVATENRYCKLSDGSEVWMRPNSIIRHSKDFIKDRRIWLRGGALFQVNKVNGKNFKVYIDQAFIEVKGTRFLIEEENMGSNKVTLFNGNIDFNVDHTGEKWEMAPMEVLNFDKSKGSVQKESLPNIKYENGKYRIQGMPLHTLLALIEDMYNTQIEYQAGNSQLTFTGFIRKNEQLSEVLNKVCYILNLHQEKHGDIVVIKNDSIFENPLF